MAVRRRSVEPYASDPALVQSCIAGDENAWNELVERYGRLVYSVSLRSGLSSADADEVFQNVFIILLRHLKNLRKQTSLSSWLIATTQRECWRLRKGKALHYELNDVIADGSPPLEDDVLRWERHRQVRQGLTRLDDRCRTLLSDLFLDPDEPSYVTIAAKLGMPLGSIGPTRARCFKKLEAVLIEMGFDPGG